MIEYLALKRCRHMDVQLFQQDIQSHLSRFVEHLQTIEIAKTIDSQSESDPTFKAPSLVQFYPQSLQELDIQRFNISGEISAKLASADAVACWILDVDTLVRSQVARYLTSDVNSLNNVTSEDALNALASKICCLDVSESFVEGLRVFLPIVGAITVPTAFHSSTAQSSEYDTIQDDSRLGTLLRAYAKAHLLFSKKPILSGTSSDIIEALTELALCVMTTFKSIQSGDKPISAINNEFFALSKAIFNRKIPGVNIDPHILSEVFASLSNGGNLIPLYIPEPAPSYLLASVVMEAWVYLSFNSDTDVKLKSYVRLTADALYVFVDQYAVSVQGCIPLEYLRPQLSGDIGCSTLTLLPVLGAVMPYIAMTSHPIAYNRTAVSWAVPEHVSYHARFILDIIEDTKVLKDTGDRIISTPMITALPSSQASREDRSKFRKHVEVVGHWLEALEACSWLSRNSY